MADIKDFEVSESIAEMVSRLSAIKNRLAKLFSNDEADTNIPDGAVRFANNRFEIYSQANKSWSELTAQYDINVDRLDGHHADDFAPVAQLSNFAHAGANSDVTSLHGLTTPLSISQGGTGATTAPVARTNLGATTVGSNLFAAANPNAERFIRINADNTISFLTAQEMLSAIGATTNGITNVEVVNQNTPDGDINRVDGFSAEVVNGVLKIVLHWHVWRDI